MNLLAKIVVDGETFVIPKQALNKFEHSVLANVVSGRENCSDIVRDSNTFYLNMDCDCAQALVSYIRGYRQIFSSRMAKKLYFDAHRFNFTGLVKILLEQHPKLSEDGVPHASISTNKNNQVNIHLNLEDEQCDMVEIDDIDYGEELKKLRASMPLENIVNINENENINELNTSLLLGDDDEMRQKFVKDLQGSLGGGNVLGLMNQLSNDMNLINMIRMFNNRFDEDDSDDDDLMINEVIDSQRSDEIKNEEGELKNYAINGHLPPDQPDSDKLDNDISNQSISREYMEISF